MKKKLNWLILWLFFFQFYSLPGNAQSGAWNANSFAFTRDNSTLEDMTGSVAVTFTGNIVESSPSIPFGGVNFRFGLASYSNFYISPFGFVKLGDTIVSNDPEKNTAVIVPLCNGTYWNANYKLTGVAPNRKMVVQYAGVMQPSGEPTMFQVWMYERTGKIQFVYEHLRGYYGFSSFWSYKIFCSTKIINANTVGALKINPFNAFPTVNYTSAPFNNDSISANTRFTFQPDTLKPTIPSQLNFTNVQGSCLSVNITEASNNESAVVLERADNGINYLTEKIFYTTTPAGSTVYTYAQTKLQPFWNYSYRVYVSNGFLNSDTVYNTVQTPMPLLSGVRTVPGDYPSITALLQDAECKALGPNLIIELQNNYSFTAETLPLTFKPVLQNRLIQSIIIRPAANANINWSTSFTGPLFYVDSVKHVFLDGRPGGTGTSQNLTVFQQNPLVSAIQYTNAADSGGINYCRIIKKNSTNLSYAIVVVPLNNAFNFAKKDINAFSITNNFISADSATVSDLIYIKPADTLQARDFIISGNQFSRFRRSAVHFENGGENLLISNNHFFQPTVVKPEVYLPYKNASCLSLLNTGTVTIDNNFFGGGSATWGYGKFSLNIASDDYAFINYENSAVSKKAFITNNKFGNIEFTGYSYTGSSLICARRGNIVIDNNRFGTADSSNSITTKEYFWGLNMSEGNRMVSNNFFSGFQGGYLNSGAVNHSYFISTASNDSCSFINNDIGGSDNVNANSSSGAIHAIYLLGAEKTVVVKNNTIRGITSRNLFVSGISGANAYTGGLPVNKIEVDSNSIHHLQAGSSATGISIFVNSRLTNRISNNTVYGLKTTGTVLNPNGGGYQGMLYGIRYSMYNYGYSPVDYKGEVQVYGNKIHSFESIRTIPSSIFSQYGITATSPLTKIYNNEIRLGINMKGQFVDSATSLNGISITPAEYSMLLADKHYVEHNTLYFGGKGNVTAALSADYSYNYVSDSNSITITNNIINIDRVPLTGSYLTSDIYQRTPWIKAFSAKNIWYSASIANTPALLQSYKQSCGCDSSSFTGNPAFINPAGDSTHYNLHLGSLSKADSAGTPPVLNIQYDLDNNNRNAYSPVDIGSYAASPCGTGVFPNITITNPVQDSVQLCSGNSLTLTGVVSGGTFTSLQWQRNLIDSAGANSATLTVNRAGNYRLVGKTACGSTASRIIYVFGSALPASVAITVANTSICAGTTVTFTALPVNNGTPVSYQWQVNGVNTGSNSSTFTSSSLQNNDKVKVITSFFNCGSPATATSNTISMTVIPAPAANAGKDTSVCTGGSVQLNGSGGTTYLWTPATGLNNPNIANPVASPVITTAYVLTVSNSGNNCIAKDTVLVTVKPYVTPAVSISPISGNVLCFGNPAGFSATPVNGGVLPIYQWQVNGVNSGPATFSINTFTANMLLNNDQVKVIMTSNAACISQPVTVSNIITVNVQQLATPQITVNNRVYTVTNPDAAAAYVWQVLSNNSWTNVVPAATGITFTAPAAGEYRVKATKGPCTVYAASLVTNKAATHNNPFGIFVYPNPAQEKITVDSIKLSQNWETMETMNAEGRIVLPVKNIQNQSKVSVDIRKLSKGTYFIRLKRKDGESTTIKFVKN